MATSGPRSCARSWLTPTRCHQYDVRPGMTAAYRYRVRLRRRTCVRHAPPQQRAARPALLLPSLPPAARLRASRAARRRLVMLPIQQLLNRIRWDQRFRAGKFEIGYYDRRERRILMVPYDRIQFPGSTPFLSSSTTRRARCVTCRSIASGAFTATAGSSGAQAGGRTGAGHGPALIDADPRVSTPTAGRARAWYGR